MKRVGARSETSPSSDPDLLRELAKGEIGALGELYDRYHHVVRCYVARATLNAEDVDDLVHATFLAAAKSAARYDGRASCRPWLVGIATQLLRRRRRSLASLFSVLASWRSVKPTMADPRERLHARVAVEKALSHLSEAKRITLLLAEVEGLSCAEIAEVSAVPIGTVWTRLHAARREMRAALGEDGDPR